MVANRAINILAQGQARIQDVPVPELPTEEYILVKVTAVALNPTDWKHVAQADGIQCVGTRVGCDYAGIVEKVGSKVTKAFKKGDRICGPANGSYVFP
jgi:NADPH:quinone reductase-like Zn-dependent oxidoreductase